jgi:GNAT superfamily N-acetyltransferase
MITELNDKTCIYEHLRKDQSLFAYHIGDLDMQPDACTWYGFFQDATVSDIVLVWRGMATPTPIVLALGLTSAMPKLVQGIIDKLPDRFICHYQKALEPIFLASYRRIRHAHGLKMDFQGLRSDLPTLRNHPCVQLTTDDQQPIVEMLQVASPNNAFHPQMLATGKFYGIKSGEHILSMAGVHVYSPTYRLAVIGNVATHPSMRRHGLATQGMVTLLTALEPDVDFIGLSMRADNAAAIAFYRRLGFSIASPYEGAIFERLSS